PLAAVAKFAFSGKPLGKKDLGMIAMSYGNVYVAKVAMGYSDAQTVRAFMEAEAFDGPSLIIAYSHCIAHGINMAHGLQHQKLAVETGQWPLYRYNPDWKKIGKNPFKLDSKAPKRPITDYIYTENRFKMLTKSMPERARKLAESAQEFVNKQYEQYKYLAEMNPAKREQ
ncbi:MAG: pyruvate:ferredoxin (flavodoxin) oxidoreductase, partial [Fidelibacterota bacterium]